MKPHLVLREHLANPGPCWLVIENVVHVPGWEGYDFLFEELHELDYRTREVVLDASDFGVPQSRRRVFILCDLFEESPEVVSRVQRVRSPRAFWRSRADTLRGHRSPTGARQPRWSGRSAPWMGQAHARNERLTQIAHEGTLVLVQAF